MTRIGISFKENEKELLEYLRTKRSISSYIKDLIEEDKSRTNKSTKSKTTNKVDEIVW